MKTHTKLAISFWVVFFIFILVCLIMWFHISQKNYDYRIYSGQKYSIGNNNYTVPDIPLIGKAYILKESYLLKQHELLNDITILLKDLHIEYWISGGTLLGFERHNTFIPWDDDCDLHTHWDNREYLFSSRFASDIEKYCMEAIFLVGASTLSASKEGAAVRVRRKNTITPICDIFFVKEKSPDLFVKVDSWNMQSITYNSKEQWLRDTLFPTETRFIDNLHLAFPRNPLKTLQNQYGLDVMIKMYSTPILFSHLFPFSMFPCVWKARITEK